MMTRILLALSLLAHAAVPAHADAQPADVVSGNYFLPGCKALIAGDNSNAEITFRAGQCIGVVSTLQKFLKGHGAACHPANIPMSQVIRVVVKYLDDHPARLHEDFMDSLAGPAIHDAWPCPARK